MTRDQKIIEAVQLGIDMLTGYILLRRVLQRAALLRVKVVDTPSSAMG